MFLITLWLLLSHHANAESSTYIVHMDKSLMPQVFASHHDWYESTIHSINLATADDPSEQQKLVYTYDDAMHGFSAVLSSEELETLKNTHGFVTAYPDRSATIDTTHTFDLTLGDGKIIVGCTLFAANSIVEKFPLIYNKTVSACNSVKLLTGVATREIIICDALDSVSVLTQIASVTAASVYGAVFISEDPELIERRRLFTPSIVISPNDAKSVIKYAKSAQKPFASINFQQTFVGIKPAPAVAIYSSRGPSPSYPGILKPDVMAPGSNVLAAFVPNKPSARIGTNVFLSILYSNKTRSTVREFRRIVTNVGDGAATYKVKVTQPKGSVVKVSPETLAFGYKNEKQSYSVTVKYTRNKKENISFGDIVWVEDGGARTVRSPIVVAPNELA
ncbi:hypothetical protein JHK82_057127 [Glycine max]|nr:hypothetical protein JHK82_057127 [Glycine max]